MMKTLTIAALLAATAGHGAIAQAEVQEPYDLLFRNGTLDEIDRDAALVYSRTVTNRLKPEAGDRDSGTIALGFSDEDQSLAELDFRQDGKHRVLARFPADVGNPMIMYFYETVVRDMAETAGGSPFYIRNRVKDALIQPAVMTEGEATVDGESIPTVSVTLRPFEGDPNVDRMQGFGDLELTVTMSEEVPGWYLSLVAEASPQEMDNPVYRSELVYKGLEEAE